MIGQTEIPDQPVPDRGTPSDAGLSRRRILKGGLAAAPVLVTLASRPVLGCETDCKSPSAFASINVQASHPGSSQLPCQGRTPGFWKNCTHNRIGWPSPYCAKPVLGFHAQVIQPATPFHCATTGFNGAVFAGKSMLDVLGLGGGDTVAVGRHVTAALLNAAMGWTPVLSETAVRGIWNDYVARGHYEPTAGVRWGADQIVAYLQSTMPL